MEKVFACNDPREIKGTDFYFQKNGTNYLLLKKNYNTSFLNNINDFCVYKHNKDTYIVCVTEEEYAVYYVNDCKRLRKIVSLELKNANQEFAITINVGDEKEKELINFYSDLSFGKNNMTTFHTTRIDNVYKDEYVCISVGDEVKFYSVYLKIMGTNWRYCYN